MTNTQSFAQQELDILSIPQLDPNNKSVILEFREEILALCEKFGNSGQSGGSAPYVADVISQTIKKLLLQKPISPITGFSQEWCEVTDNLWQNRRCYSLFKKENGVVTFGDAIVYKNQNGGTYSGRFWKSKEDYLTGNRELMIRSQQEIKGFPFTPKTFYIDVIEEEVEKDDFEMYLKDPKQLEEVWEYYKKPDNV